MRMKDVEVLCEEDGGIIVSQWNYERGEADRVLLYPEQIDLLIKWLKYAREQGNGE